MADDQLTLTIRLHDPQGVVTQPFDPKRPTHQEAASRAEWAVAKIARADLQMPLDEFMGKYVKPMLSQMQKVAGK